MITEIVKRNGTKVPFDQNKIVVAMRGAFGAENVSIDDASLQQIADRVCANLVIVCEGKEDCPNVEQVQDQVENTLMERGYFNVAKAYILYRFKHTEVRREETVKEIEENRLRVKHTDGSAEHFSSEKIRDYILQFAEGYENHIRIDDVVAQLEREVYDGIQTSEVARLVTFVLRARIEQDTAYTYVAARQLCARIREEAVGKVTTANEDEYNKAYRDAFVKNMKLAVKEKKLDEQVLSFDLEKLAAMIDPSRDDLFKYLGVETLHDRYFIRLGNKRVLETPQMLWMRVAIGLAFNEQQKEERAIEFYEVMSTLRFVPSTPTLFHAGTLHPQLSSCYLNVVEDDLKHIFKVYSDNAMLSKWAGGIGTAWTKLRGTGAAVGSTGINSQGTVPFLKIANDVTVAINRSGRRRGATCVYMENWHIDFEDFLELRKNTGDERRRTHDMNTAAWVSDLFMKRVREDGEWTLFSPDETPELPETYGKEFERLYEGYEEMAKRGELTLTKTVRARDLWKRMLGMLYETGHPWVTFKDPSNIRSPQDHVGVVHNSNLCTEITLNTSKDETAVCNLGSVNYAKHVTNGAFDTERIKDTVTTAMRMLDNVVDLNFYPTIEARNSNMKHRPVGLGIMGFQDALYMLDIPFGSERCLDFADQSMEVISYHAILGSAELARERGAYESFAGSKWDRGLLPVDTIRLLEEERGVNTGIDRTERLDWNVVRETIKQYGMRNSNTMAVAPTATISNIAGSIPGNEPIYKNIYVKSNISGDFIVINTYLVDELKSMGLWSPSMLEKLKYHDGSLTQIDEIPQEIKNKYKETFEIDMRWLIRAAAVRGKWIDQSQSLNIFYRGSSGKEVSDLYQYAWELGVKTTYYLRTLAASQVEKSTIGTEGTHLRQDPNAERKGESTTVASPLSENAEVGAVTPQSPVIGAVPSPIATPSPITKVSMEKTKAEVPKKKQYNLHVDGDAICESCQ